MKLIDKSALIAEIERRIKEIDEIGTYLSPKGVLTNLLCHLDTLEVKEVDLEMELDRCLDLVNGEEYEHISIYQQLSIIARYFFSLGLNAQKGKFKKESEINCPNFDEAQGTNFVRK